MRLFLLATALLFTASVADAQIQQDVIQVGGTGNLSIEPEFAFGLAPVVGYFITDNIEVGGNPRLATDFSDFFNATISAFGNYYPTGGTDTNTYPFIGANLGVNVGDGGGGIGIGGQAGVQRFISDTAALTLAVRATTDDDFDEVTLLAEAGFSIFINRGAAEDVIESID
ncbi:hypothetical protein RQM47_12720 [Rubrivirga sp. S365]|uniref:Outer membrane protein beta-barrel domain-containing protein n=1 Tax=Rubrivirga litoralis TaxID=3075598 RepID=A0ABU3BV14_9BACT|nr:MULTISPECIES: hypothetical protein [unclassified Rubrivirga]MDT0633132.1 hypothetical protein [Rubrivirga sp. F394]MDT7857507.1 hypothetical protein [Rubrivirga sp. S365]